MQKDLQEIRCKCCKKLLARTKNNQYLEYLEIKCTRCKTLNVFNRNKN